MWAARPTSISTGAARSSAKACVGDFAVVTETGTTGSTTTATSYLLRDHLGSVDVITDELGAVLEQMSFDSWGKRRNVDWTPMVNPTAYLTTLTTRGFTGHEQLDSAGLGHMNGRGGACPRA